MVGFIGKLLHVDLKNKKTKDMTISKEDQRDFLGGRGLGAKILYDNLKPGVDPLGPDNILLFMTGPLQGATIPGHQHYVVISKSPQTGGFAEAHAGGSIGPEIKYSGYDGIIFHGVSSEPVYLWLHDGEAEIKSAVNLWGKHTHDTETIIKKEIGEPKASVASIGLGGENLVKFSGIISDLSRAAARTGVGAVMGSKKLKAIAILGNEKKIPLADRNLVFDLAKKYTQRLLNHQGVLNAQKYGTPYGIPIYNSLGILPTKNFQTGIFKSAEKISGETMTSSIIKGVFGCIGCPVRCWRVVEVKEGKYKGDFNDGPEYETIASFGSLCLNDNLEAISYANHLCNLYSLDTISTGNVIAFAMECYEKGLITEKDIGGVKLKWGDSDAIIQMIEMIATRKDFGDVLAEGVKRAAEIIGHEAESFANEVKGLEIPMHEPRGKKAVGLMYATAARGAVHSDGFHDTGFQRPNVLPELGLIKAMNRNELHGKPRLMIKAQDAVAVQNSLMICSFTGNLVFRPATVADYITWIGAVTGLEYDITQLILVGERINNLTRAFNIREGMSRKDDYLPLRFSRNMLAGASSDQKITNRDLEEMLDEYYQLRGWDQKTGIPTADKLANLGLDQIAKDIKAP